MTIKEVVIIIASAVLSAFAKSIFDRIFGKYKLNTSKLISWIKKSLLFSIRYVLPILGIISLMNLEMVVNKLFVLLMCINFFAVTLNLSADYTIHWIRHLTNSKLEHEKRKLEAVDKMIEDHKIKTEKKQTDT